MGRIYELKQLYYIYNYDYINNYYLKTKDTYWQTNIYITGSLWGIVIHFSGNRLQLRVKIHASRFDFKKWFCPQQYYNMQQHICASN